ncbi:hypothetical protein [Neorhizobium petrolearium]|uniref:hypothetical protein n=1 Tax=Neorhizobium petrolearium TaxID=515361 RepID=UPI003F7CFABE
MINPECLWRDLLIHAGFGEKAAGGAGDLATAEWITRELERLGYEVERLRIPVPLFQPCRCEVVGSNCALELFPQPVVVPTPDEGIAAPLALVHSVSDAAAAQGRIAIILLPYARHAAIWTSVAAPLLTAVAEAGALAVVILPFGPTGEIVGLNSYADKPFIPIPVAIGRPSDLAAYAGMASANLTVRLYLTGENRVGDSPTLMARRHRGVRWIAMSTPRSGFFTCSVERGTGTATFLWLAAWLPKAFPDHSLFLLNSGAHELRFAGTHSALDLAPSAGVTDMWAHIGAGLVSRAYTTIRGGRRLDTADPNRICMTTPSLAVQARAAFSGLAGLDGPQSILSEVGELSTIVERGYDKAFACLGVNRSCHTRLDVSDEVTPDLLASVVEGHRRLIEMAVAPAGRSG